MTSIEKIDSGYPAEQLEHDSVYATSEPQDESERWGQLAASKYVFWIEGHALRGTLVSGVYYSIQSAQTADHKSALAAELEAWDSLSDEALLSFEETLE